MLTTSLKALFERDLSKLITEIKSYKNESDMWRVGKGISNSGGNLCLHLIGNLNLFIGTTLGGTGYVRNREAEFSSTNVSAAELIAALEALKGVIPATLDKLKETDLQQEYPVNVFNKPMTTEYFLVHLVSHLGYHLGQINYHRRLLEGE